MAADRSGSPPPKVSRREFLQSTALIAAAGATSSVGQGRAVRGLSSASWALSGLGNLGRSAARQAARPNIVVIVTDDQRWDTLWAMPNVRDLLCGHGVTFTNAYVTNPLCSPSRATMLTGGHSHDTGIYSNTPPTGGFAPFNDESTVATWLRHAGYTTGLVGKYLNKYGSAARAGKVPPGWDRWFAFAENNSKFYDYWITVDGRRVWHGDRPDDYSTRVLMNEAVSFIRGTRSPLFLYLATASVHEPWAPDPLDEHAFPGLEQWRPPNWNESDVSDKPKWLQKRPPFTLQQIAKRDRVRRHQYQSLRAVDRGVARIVQALAETGRLSNTLLVLMGDNGFMWGEHRMIDKQVPYEESIRVPLVVRFDPATRSPRDDGHLVLNLDLARTVADAANIEAPGAQGLSLLPLVSNPAIDWRSDFLIEHAVDPNYRFVVPAYLGLHTQRHVYVLYSTGAQELYDLDADPYQLKNLALERRDEVARMRHRLATMVPHLPPGWDGPGP